MSDRIAVMRAGKVLQVGTPARLLSTVRTVRRRLHRRNQPPGGDPDRGAPFPLGQRHRAGCGRGGGRRHGHFGPEAERATLVAPGGEGIPESIEQVVYVGADTTYHVRLAGGLGLRLRDQNRDGSVARRARGDAVGVLDSTGSPAGVGAVMTRLRRWGLLAPSMAIIGLFVVAPLGFMAFVSTLDRGPQGTVVWDRHSLDAYTQFLFERDLTAAVLNTDYLRSSCRSVLAVGR